MEASVSAVAELRKRTSAGLAVCVAALKASGSLAEAEHRIRKNAAVERVERRKTTHLLTVKGLKEMVDGLVAQHGLDEETAHVELSLAPFPNQPHRRFFCGFAGDGQDAADGIMLFLDLLEDNEDMTE